MSNIFSENIMASIGIIVSLFCVIASSRILIAKDKRNKFNEAANNFRNIFEAIKTTIEQNPDLPVSQIVEQILKTNYPEQRIAMGTLSKQMWPIKRRAFSKAWQAYENPENCGNEPFLSYSGIPWEAGKTFDREYILHAIEHLISFANK